MPTLHWIGKDKVVNHHQDVPFRVIEHKYGFADGKESKNETGSGNKIIHGDNLEALKTLLPEYEGRIKCIYIDPPYNTGNESWVYNDNVNDPKMKKWLGEVVGKEGEDLSRHDKWLCMMYPRLKLLHKLLADDGAIFISIDDNEQANLRLLCDEIFGGSNFVSNIIWQKKYSPQNDARFFSDMHDFIICYAKNKNNDNKIGWKRNLLARTDEQNDRYKNPDDDPRGPWKPVDLSCKTYSVSTDYEITTPSGRIVKPASSRCWVVSKEKFNEMIQDNRIWFGKDGSNVPSQKKFITEVQQGTVPVTIWFREEVGDNQEAKQDLKQIFKDSKSPFDTPKPSRMIKRILEIATDPGDIILDSFAGSGTTGQAVLNLNKEDGGNRKFILVEMEEYAETITAERVRRVINGYGDVPGTGGSFDYYTLGESLFDEDKNINENLPVDKIRQYVYYTETGSPLGSEKHKDNEFFLSLHEGAAYYFYYMKGETTALDYDFLKTIKTKAEMYVVYADNCLLPDEFMKEKNIFFKKIPRDIARV